ncbi:MAG TPA: hypothetical protein VK163_06620 [Opitutaceae bacterium]|nr:hypothetical protein [Opitutaceae bacterium]
MNTAELDRLLTAVTRGDTLAREAIRQLVAAGHDQDLAAELVFIALGGGDVIETGSDGRERYASGRLVADVQAEMAR